MCTFTRKTMWNHFELWNKQYFGHYTVCTGVYYSIQLTWIKNANKKQTTELKRNLPCGGVLSRGSKTTWTRRSWYLLPALMAFNVPCSSRIEPCIPFWFQSWIYMIINDHCAIYWRAAWINTGLLAIVNNVQSAIFHMLFWGCQYWCQIPGPCKISLSSSSL